MECLLTDEELLEEKAKIFLRRNPYLRALTRKMSTASHRERVEKGLAIAKNMHEWTLPHTDPNSASISVDHKPMFEAWNELKDSKLPLSQLDPFSRISPGE